MEWLWLMYWTTDRQTDQRRIVVNYLELIIIS